MSLVVAGALVGGALVYLATNDDDRRRYDALSQSDTNLLHEECQVLTYQVQHGIKGEHLDDDLLDCSS